jgi:hypothetical protein
MDGKWTGQFFSWDSCSPANLPIAQGSKSVPGVGSKIGVHPTGWSQRGGGVFVGVGWSQQCLLAFNTVFFSWGKVGATHTGTVKFI